VNPLSFAKDDVICTCPDAPIDPANDQYPWPEGEGWEEVPEEEEAPAVPEGEEESSETEAQSEPIAEPSEETSGESTQTRSLGSVSLSAVRPLFAARQGHPKIFAGRMLCAQGETSCEHPCSAFHTISETDTDCHCKCTVNPLSFAKDDVICTCPDAPIDPANDQYPWPEGEGWEVPEEEEEVPAVPEEDEANPEAEEAVDTTAPTAPVDEETTGENTPTTTTTTTQTRARGAMALAALRARRARMQLALQQQHQQQAYPYVQFDSFAPPSFLPPDGDYPGGSTGIPMDGYIGFDTGHGQQPYHGTYAPMQESGIADGRKRGGSALRQGRAGGSEEERGAVLPPWSS